MKKNLTAQSAFFHLRVLTVFVLLLGAVFLALYSFGVLSRRAEAESKGGKKIDPKEERDQYARENPAGVRVIASYYNDVSRPLRNAPSLWPPKSKRREEAHEANPNPKIQHQHVDGKDPVIQNNFFRRFLPSIPGPTLSFAGVPFPGVACNCAPPDPNGAIGKNHYVQMVNEGYQVFNKTTGASVLGPNSIESVWMGFAGACETGGFGDPVVMYDQLADRWIITEFASATGGSPITDECVAISATGDPTGAYYRYGYHLGANFFDYPHLGVWPDAYYMSMNVFNSGGTAFLGVQPFAFDRAKMLIGAPATIVTTGLAPGADTEDYFLPANLDGVIPPPSGAPNPFVEFPGTSPVYKVYLMHADFVTPANTTFTLVGSPAAAAYTALCPTTRACVPQPNGQTLDGIGDRVMFRNAYRKFPDGHDAVVNNYSVSAGGVSGVRWFELRNVLVTPVVFQESTYQPDTTWRWMGSAAMDNQGNMAVGFSASSATVVPALRYAGRLAGDPVNSLAQGENTLFAGAGSQASGTGNRWGDYSDLTVDPVDDCTFWYTGEFYPAGSADFNWRTQIGNFAFTQCTAPAKGTAHFTVTICDGGAALPNAAVSIDGMLYGSTIAGGVYDAALTPGNHTYSVSKLSYGTVTGNFNITNGNTTNVSFCMTGVPVIDPAGSALVSEGCAPPNGVVDPGETVTVNLTVTNSGGASTTNLVGTLQNSGGVTPTSGPQNYGVIAPGGNATRSFSFTAPNAACGTPFVASLQLQDGATNLGTITYNFTTGVVLVALSENFDGVVAPALPAGWVASNASGAALWTTSTATPFSAPNEAFIDDPTTVSDKRLDTPGISITSTVAQVTFRNSYNLESGFDGGVLEVSSPNINAGAFTDITDPLVGGSFVSGGYVATISTGFSSPIGGRQAWTGNSGGYITTVANLGPNVANQTIKLRFRMASDTSATATGWMIDNVSVSNGFACCGAIVTAVPPPVVTAESAFPPNGTADPGETLTVNLSLHDVGTSNTTNLVATLLPTGGVTNPSGPQTYGVLVGLGAPVAKPFTFTASGPCGSTITLTLALQDGATSLGNVTFTMVLGSTVSNTQTFTNAAAITIPATGTGATTGAPAAPYPSTIVASGLSTTASKITVTFFGMNHTFPGDVDVLLVSPTGKKFILMSDAGASNDWVNAQITLDDSAAALMADAGANPSGTYKPTNYGTGDLFPAPAPASPYLTPATAGTDTLTSAFTGVAGGDPNGTWSLYVVDDASTDVGSFSGGWSISFTTTTPVCAVPVTAASVKTHGGAGAMSINMPLAGNTGIEDRSGGATNDHQLVVTFPGGGYSATGAPQAQVLSGTATIGTGGVANGGAVAFSGGGSVCTVPLTNVANAQVVSIRINGVTDGTHTGNLTIPMAFLTGDSNGDASVNSADISQTKARSGQAVTGTNFTSDVNADGTLNSADISLVKSRTGTALP